MTWLDRYLQRQRFKAAASWIPSGARVLDLGSNDGSLLVALNERIGPSMALDPKLEPCVALDPRHSCVTGVLEDLALTERFDAVCALAMFEHLEETELNEIASGLFARIVAGGVLVATVPEPCVDEILDVLVALRLVAGQSLHEHHGAEPQGIEHAVTTAGFVLRHHGRFELGLNHLFVFDRPD